MARQRISKSLEARANRLLRKALPPEDVGDNNSDNEGSDIMEKDEDEEELDRLVLGGGDFMEELGRDETEEHDQMNLDDTSEAELEAQLGLDQQEEGLENVDDADLFFLDDAAAGNDGNLILRQPRADDDQPQDVDAPAWEDSDDDRLTISLAGNPRLRKLRLTEADDIVSGTEYVRRLRQQYQILHPTPEWARSDRPVKRRRRSSETSTSSLSAEDSDMEDDLSALPLARLLQDTGGLKRTSQPVKSAKLRPEVINIQRARDIPLTQPSAITSLSFHPEYPALLSSGPASTIYLHHVDSAALPTPHPLVTSVHIKSTPLHTTAFLPPTGSKIFFAGRRRYFHTWDLESGNIQKVSRVYGQKDEQKSMEEFKLSPCGRYMALLGTARKGGGIVNFLDAATCQWFDSARMEGRGGIADFAWWSDGEGMTIASKNGEIGEWNMQKGAFEVLWQDEGAVGTTVITLGGRSGSTHLGGDRWVVIGSSSGIVNIYDRRPWLENGASVPSKPTPTKVLGQLTTPTSHLIISPDGQLLVMGSRWKKDALRLVHLGSCTVYKNWPTSQTPLGKITAVAFSTGSDMLAVANEQGKIRLWDIRA